MHVTSGTIWNCFLNPNFLSQIITYIRNTKPLSPLLLFHLYPLHRKLTFYTSSVTSGTFGMPLKYSGICKLDNLINVTNKVLYTRNFLQSTLYIILCRKVDLNIQLQILSQYNNFPTTTNKLIYYQKLGVRLKINNFFQS